MPSEYEALASFSHLLEYQAQEQRYVLFGVRDTEVSVWLEW